MQASDKSVTWGMMAIIATVFASSVIGALQLGQMQQKIASTEAALSVLQSDAKSIATEHAKLAERVARTEERLTKQ